MAITFKPAVSTRFELDISGKKLSLIGVSGLEVKVAYGETQTVANARISVKNPGEIDQAELQLTRHVDDDKTLWEWHDETARGQGKNWMKEGSIIIYAHDGSEIIRYNFIEAWPQRVACNGFDATSNEPLTEECTLIVHDLVRVK